MDGGEDYQHSCSLLKSVLRQAIVKVRLKWGLFGWNKVTSTGTCRDGVVAGYGCEEDGTISFFASVRYPDGIRYSMLRWRGALEAASSPEQVTSPGNY
jgi:hypothetical protein